MGDQCNLVSHVRLVERRDKSSNRTLKHHRWPKCLQVACLNDRLRKLELQSLCPRTLHPHMQPRLGGGRCQAGGQPGKRLHRSFARGELHRQLR